jgi:hypothetical protein
MTSKHEAVIVLEWLARHPATLTVDAAKGVWTVTHWRTGERVEADHPLAALRLYRKATARTRRRTVEATDE